jgi:Rrf2 family protein
MKISTKGRYGVRILLDLAIHHAEKPRQIRDIAKSQGISEKYISRLIIALRRARMVRSIRGVNGGFQLAKPPAEITLLAIVEVMEGPLAIVDCVRTPAKCSRTMHCAVHDIWNRLNADIRDAMQKLTLADIIEHYNQVNADSGLFDYCI